MRSRTKLDIVTQFAAICLLAASSAAHAAGQLIMSVTGPPQLVVSALRDGCKLPHGYDMPDMKANAFRRADGTVVLLSGNHFNMTSTGPSLDAISKRDCTPVLVSPQDPDPSHQADAEWLNAVEPLPDGTFLGFVHEEFHGFKHNIPGCPVGRHNGDSCWYASALLVVSRDGGHTFHNQPPAQGILGTPPQPFVPGQERQALTSPKAVRNPVDGYFYVLLSATIKSTPVGQCLVRGRSANAAEWRLWNGHDFSSPPQNVYAPGAPAYDHPCATVLPINIFSLKYVTSLKQYVALGQHGGSVEYYSSPDMIHWSGAQVLLRFNSDKKGGSPVAPTSYYSLLGNTSSPSFDDVGTSAYIYFVRWNQGGGNGAGYDRDLLRMPVRISGG
jgi:hypothetical protein